MPTPSDVRRAFELFDADQSGSISTSEFVKVAESLGKSFSQKELTDSLKRLDKSGRGEVSYEDFAAYWAEMFSGEYVHGEKMAAIMAQFADANHIEGVAYHPDRYMDEDDEMRARVWVLFEEIDANKDHHINYVEFINWWKKRDKAEGHGTISDEVLMSSRDKFRQYDTNGNGTIDRDELAGLLRALNLEKYVPTAEEIEARQTGPPKLPSPTPEEVAALQQEAAGNAEDAIVEGEMKQLVVDTSTSKQLIGIVKTGFGAIAGSEVPNLGGKNKKEKQVGEWLDRNVSLTANGLIWLDPASGDPAQGSGNITLEEIKRVSPSDAAEDKGLYAFEVVLRTLVNDSSVVYMFAADSADEREEWMDSIKQTVVQEVHHTHKPKSINKQATHKVSAADLDAQMKQAFAAFDANNSGSLDSGELNAVAKQLGKQLTSAELAQMMAELDSDGNGEVSLAEFSKFWKEKFTGTLVAGSKLAAMVAQFADTRHIEGVAYHPDRYVDPADEMRARCWALFEEIDSNHDNHITYIEFLKWFKMKDKEEHHGQATLSDDVLRQSQEKFNAYDTNGNGTIDRDELAGLIRALDLEKYVPTAEELADEDPPLYTVHVHTGGHPEAGTDATVHIILHGADGDTGRRELTSKKAADSFNRGQINTFKLRSIDVGTIDKVTIGHDNVSTDALANNAKDATGAKAKYLQDEACKWQLDKVVVKKRGGEPITFGCAEWLDINSGDKLIERTLYPGERKFSDEVTVHNPMRLGADDTAAEETKGPADPSRKLIVEYASGLNNADTFFGGKSDPYAIISWNGKVLGKTQTKDNTLHPIWNEEFDFDVAEEGLLRIEVYDHDVFFKDDLLGKVELKLGGMTNPHAMLQRSDYTFQEPEEFKGSLTLRVEHGSHRFSTEEQLLFRDRFNNGETMRARREKHVFKSNTRLIVLLLTFLMTIFGGGMFGYSLWLLFQCQIAPLITYGYLFISPIIALTSAFGFYGAWRVKDDTEASKQSTEGNIAHGPDDDGLQTTGQVILEVYFHISLVTIICWLWLIIETFAVGSAGADAGCHTDHDGGIELLAFSGLAAIVFVILCMHMVVKIVSFFEILQSLAEGINVCLLLLGFAIMLLGALFLKQGICLTPPDQLETQKGNLSLAVSILVFGLLVAITSFFGFVAAVHESMSHLFQHAIMLSVLTVMGLILAGFLFIRGVDSLIDDNCENLLNTLPATFFEEYASCSKYRGYTELWNGTHWQIGEAGNYVDVNSGEGFVADLGDMAICNPKELNSFAWEVNPYTRPDGSTVNYYGCLNNDPVHGCCEAIKDKMHAFDYGIVALFALLFAMMGAGIYASMYLRYETTIIGHILIHPYAKKIFWGMKITMLLACIGIPVLLTGTNCGGIETTDLDAQKNLVSKGLTQTSVVVASPSCVNGFLDGRETDIDCGGECAELCGRDKACEEDGDCRPGLLCAAQDDRPVRSMCWDDRCVPGQFEGCTEGPDNGFTGCRLQGICAYPTPFELCNDSEMNYRETDQDCGGPDCRGLDVPQLCNLDQGCSRGTDCKGACTGTRSDGSACNSVAAFMAPGGSGAEVHCPTDDGCVFTPSQCLGGLCKAICNQELEDLIDAVNNTCGGECEPCPDSLTAPGFRCAVDSDCMSGRCYRPTDAVGECVSYYNGRQDGSETAIDCGGDDAARFPCELGSSCSVDTDCSTGNCGGTCSGTVASTGLDCTDGTAFRDTGAENDCPTTDGCVYVGNTCAVVTPSISCNDTIRNFLETDLDCGGTSCVTVGRTCDTGMICEVDADCTAGACSPDSRCFGCGDGELNGDETDTDCGGATCGRKCPDANTCEQDSDCLSDRCFEAPEGAKVCVSYYNNERDGDETDVDCGGSAVERGYSCTVGQRCGGNVDCSTSVCGTDDENDSECVARNSTNAAAVAACDAVTDLLNSTVCESTTTSDGNGGTLQTVCEWSSRCRTRTPLEVCTDGQQTFPETDVDCGGSPCRSVGRFCADGMECLVDADCAASSSCHAGTGRCVSCTNGIQDGDETDVDCGGVCSQCASLQACIQNGDCASSMCYHSTSAATGANGVCTSCTNHIMDGTETDVDCGGDCSKGCSVDQGCHTSDDCAVGICESDSGPLRCHVLTPQETCNNNVQDREETDVDCGGSECATLPKGCLARANATSVAQRCEENRDCQASAYCFLGHCSSCANNLQDGDESDIDCGGSNGCARCAHKSPTRAAAQFCYGNSDCVSNLCHRVGRNLVGQCVSYQNQILDGTETCVDGGGGADAPTCPLGGGCASDSDCSTNKCQQSCPNCGDGFVPGDASTCDGTNCMLSSDIQNCTCTPYQCRSLLPSEGCNNGEQDGAETDIDCGGASCATVSKQCEAATATTPAQHCELDRDCNGRCDDGMCVSCSNSVLDGDETDVDCGGSCGACRAAISVCNGTRSDNSECAQASSFVASGECPDECTYSIIAAQQCRGEEDCDTLSCYRETAGQAGVCTSDSNRVLDGDESDVDCGGTTQNICEVGQACQANSDCETACRTCPESCGVNIDFQPGSVGTRGVDDGTCHPDCTLSDDLQQCTCTPNVCRDLTPEESCNNGELDGAETDVDCGGEVCASIGNRCNAPTVTTPLAQQCSVDRDCVVPAEGGRPAYPARCSEGICTSCSNGVQDGDESDVDCGGSCGGCSAASPVCTGTRNDSSDCEQTSAFVASGSPSDCPDECTFMIRPANFCIVNSDCLSSHCHGRNDNSLGEPVCVDSSNRVQDGDETCIDGGGPDSRACDIGDGCEVDADCSTNKCADSVCEAMTAMEQCTDGVLGPDETDIDCGGPTCATVDKQCGVGFRCFADSDCGTPASPDDRCFDNATQFTAPPCGLESTSCSCMSCNDNVKNGDETDTDCGGGCPSCPLLGKCTENSDCITNNCVNSVCEQTAEVLCTNQEWDPNSINDNPAGAHETDVDCGGEFCGQCADGLNCTQAQDCASNVCTDLGDSQVCTSCGNHVRDGLETDVDCGSDACPNIACRINQWCKENVDCGSGNCDTSGADDAANDGLCDLSIGCGTCRAPLPSTTCNDEVIGQTETCVDGGGDACRNIGNRCPTCGSMVGGVVASGNACTCRYNTDCIDGYCSSSMKCFSCNNGIQDPGSDETDVDCGGPCNQCHVGQMCNVDDDCGSGSCTDWGTGVAAADGMRCSSCTNGVQDGLETDVDCGAEACDNTCDDGLRCTTNDDCSSGNCNEASYVCEAPTREQTCNDNVIGQFETCTDGGGFQCTGSPLRQRCSTCEVDPLTGIVDPTAESCGCHMQRDCSSRLCYNGFCFSCHNLIKDGSETGVDCGGACSSCPAGESCQLDWDCGSRSCLDWDPDPDNADMRCTDCTNGQQEEIEADVDCGAAAGCQLCNVGQTCFSDADCNSQMCLDEAGTDTKRCVEPTPDLTCNDGQLGESETCIDGGGEACASIGNTCPTCEATCTGVLASDGVTDCATVQEFITSQLPDNCPDGCTFGVNETSACLCTTDADCDSKCSVSGYCFSCTNSIQDGDESDIDCGGSCNRCAVGQRCSLADDCSSGVCTDLGSNGGMTCTSCSNNIEDGLETDVDCGYRACPGSLCGLNQNCDTNDDCASANCGDNTCQPPTPEQTCNDGEIGQQETCVDGGGAQCRGVEKFCMTCAQATRAEQCTCHGDGDCAGDAFCDAAGIGGTVGCFSCSNDSQDGPETDVDCGGGWCDACAVGQRCSVDSDCTSSQCTDLDTTGTSPNLRCTSCSNGQMDGLETDVDCGVAACGQPCQQGQGCASSDDCASGTCAEQCQAAVSGVPADVANCSAVDINAIGAADDCNNIATVADPAVPACVYTAPWTCAPPSLPDVTCNDGLRGELETDVDCGGVACTMLGKQCNFASADGLTQAQMCADEGDCVSPGDCVNGLCVSCRNELIDGLESDQDCGGPSCPACSSASTTQPAKQCSFGSDCESYCYMPCDPQDEDACPGTATCDGFRDVYLCTADSEWAPSVTGERPTVTNMGTCVSFQNRVSDGLETDIDCGGNAPIACSLNMNCLLDEDCASGNCLEAQDGTSACAPPDPIDTCNDGEQGELETDVDCGGSACRGLGLVCQIEQQCETNADCATNACSTTSGRCSDCSNGIQDGDETDVDCGGGTCSLCDAGLVCSSDSDCQSGVCSNEWDLPDSTTTCFRPGDISFESAGTIDLPVGGAINRALWIEAQHVPVHPLFETETAPCDLEVRVTTTNGTRIVFEEASESCAGANAVVVDESTDEGLNYIRTLRGSLVCISELLVSFGLDSSCTTKWGYEGDHSTGTDDLTWAQISAEITDWSQCSMYENTGEPSASVDVRLVGRMQVEVIGYVLPARCKSDQADAEQCKDAAIAGATITGAVHPCQSAASCQDDLDYPRLSCNMIINVIAIKTCEDDTGDLVPELTGTPLSAHCRQTCNTCPDTGSSATSGTVQGSRGTEGPLSEGAFEMAVAFSPSDARRGSSAMITIAMPSYKTVTLNVPLENGVVDVGNVYMPEQPPLASVGISGVCVDYFAPSDGERGPTFMTLENGIGWAGLAPVAAGDDAEQNLYPDECASPCAARGYSSGCTCEDNSFNYDQSPQQLGAKTATCTLGNSTSTQYITSNGAEAETAAQPMLISNPDEGFVAVLNWVDANQPADFASIADIEFYAMFGVDEDGDGTDDGAGCSLGPFFNTPECSRARHLLDGPDTLPDTTPMVEILAEAISLDQLYQTVYTFYAHNRAAVDRSITCSSASDSDCEQIIDMTVEVFGPSGKVFDMRPYSQSMAVPYTRLFCIDATQTPPVIHAALATSVVGSPPRCTECPC